MKNSFKSCSLVLLIGQSALANFAALDQSIRKIDSELEALIADMKKQTATDMQKSHLSNLQVSLNESGEAVQVAIKLPNRTSDSNKSDCKVDIQAEGGALDGELVYDNHRIKIQITDGQILKVTHKFSSREDSAEGEKKAAKQFSMTSQQSLVLPAQVTKLENTKAEFKDDNLVLVLPKAETNGRGWSKIIVKQG